MNQGRPDESAAQYDHWSQLYLPPHIETRITASAGIRLLPLFGILATLGAMLVAAALLWPAPALGHGGNPDYRSVIDEVRPPVEGLEFEVIDYDADVRMTVPAGLEVEVPGYDGEPYARVLADGTVQVNLNSPSAYINTERYGTTEIPERADPEAEPEWETSRDDGVFQWHDHRSHWMSPEPSERWRDETERTKIFDYEIPIKVDGRPAVVHGTLYWAGSDSGSKLPFMLAGAAIIAAGLAATLIARRRRAAAEADPTRADRDGGW